LGLLVCYAIGTAWFIFVYTGQSGEVSLSTVLGWCVVPFILPDLLKLVFAITVSRRIRRVTGGRGCSFSA
ncbi:MAG: biotin transporter BioY, partial [Lachnospiraceae bacterium]